MKLHSKNNMEVALHVYVLNVYLHTYTRMYTCTHNVEVHVACSLMSLHVVVVEWSGKTLFDVVVVSKNIHTRVHKLFLIEQSHRLHYSKKV